MCRLSTETMLKPIFGKNNNHRWHLLQSRGKCQRRLQARMSKAKQRLHGRVTPKKIKSCNNNQRSASALLLPDNFQTSVSSFSLNFIRINLWRWAIVTSGTHRKYRLGRSRSSSTQSLSEPSRLLRLNKQVALRCKAKYKETSFRFSVCILGTMKH